MCVETRLKPEVLSPNRLRLSQKEKKKPSSDFLPAKPIPVLIRLFQSATIGRMIFSRAYKCGWPIRYFPCEIDRLRQLRDERVMFVSNHISPADGAVMFDLARESGMDVHILSNREQFDNNRGIYGWFLQSVRCFSVTRGIGDRPSIKYMRDLLTDGPNKIAIFPEGGIYGRYDKLFLFQPSVFYNAQRVLEQMDRKGMADTRLYIQPVAIRYEMDEAADVIENRIKESLLRLEKALGIRTDQDENDGSADEERLTRIGMHILGNVEDHYGISAQEKPINERLIAVKEEMLSQFDLALGGKRGEGDKSVARKGKRRVREGIGDRAAAAFNRFDGASFRDKNSPKNSYATKLVDDKFQKQLAVRMDFHRLANWLAVDFGYVAQNPCKARVVDTLIRMEREVLQKEQLKVHTKCVVRLADPIELREYFSRNGSCLDQSEGKWDADALTKLVEASVQKLLDEH